MTAPDPESIANRAERWTNRKQNEQPYRDNPDLWIQDAIRLADAYSAAQPPAEVVAIAKRRINQVDEGSELWKLCEYVLSRVVEG